MVILLVALLPPLSTQARRFVFLEALQFSLLALVVPALLVLGSPWRALRLAGRPALVGAAGPPEATSGGLVDRLAERRRHHLGPSRAVAALLVEMACIVVCRTTWVVNHLEADRWLILGEAVLLLASGSAFFSEILESPPLAPRLTRPMRVALAALTMWTVWISAYVVGLSRTRVYDTYHSLGHVGMSVAADQEIATFVLWFAAATVFVPVVFANLMTWLRAEEDPDHGLYRLLKENRRRGFAGAPPEAGTVGRGGSGTPS